MKKKNKFEKYLNKQEAINESSMNNDKINNTPKKLTRNMKFIEDKKIQNQIENKFDYFNPIYNQINLNNVSQEENEALTKLLSEKMINISKVNDPKKNDIVITEINVHKIISKILEMSTIIKNPELLENYVKNTNENYDNGNYENNDNYFNDYNDNNNNDNNDYNSNLNNNIDNVYDSHDILQKYGDDMRFFGELIKNSTEELEK